MPIFMEIEGIKGNVKASGHPGGANFALMDGSVRNISRSVSDGGPRVTVFDGRDRSGGIRISAGDFTSDSGGGIHLSRISLPHSPSGAIDALAPNAVAKARTLFEAQRSTVRSLGVVFSIPTSGANKFLHANNLRQIAIAATGRISTIRLFITDGSNQTGAAVELENVLITNFSISGHGGDTHAGSHSGQGKMVRIAFCK